LIRAAWNVRPAARLRRLLDYPPTAATADMLLAELHLMNFKPDPVLMGKISLLEANALRLSTAGAVKADENRRKASSRPRAKRVDQLINWLLLQDLAQTNAALWKTLRGMAAARKDGFSLDVEKILLKNGHSLGFSSFESHVAAARKLKSCQ
ncbi:MAG: hypothetical protein ACK5JI_07090, partial [Azonexus sp.]